MNFKKIVVTSFNIANMTFSFSFLQILFLEPIFKGLLGNDIARISLETLANKLSFVDSIEKSSTPKDLNFVISSCVVPRGYFRLKLSLTSRHCPQWLVLQKFVLSKQL